MIVKLLRRYGNCNAGELCGVPDDRPGNCPHEKRCSTIPECMFKLGLAEPISGPVPRVEDVKQDVSEDVEVLGLSDRVAPDHKMASAPNTEMLPMAPMAKGRRR